MNQRCSQSLLVSFGAVVSLFGALLPKTTSAVEGLAPFLSSYCADCHGADDPDGGISLLPNGNQLPASLGDADLLAAILEQLETGAMPPREEDVRPSSEEAEEAASLVAERLLALSGGEFGPGRVTARRLSKHEYKNTIRDLFGLEFAPADSFPSDEVSHGFDNLAEAISLSPLLMEKLVSAAEEISDLVVGDVFAVIGGEREALAGIMRRAYRRPPREEEVDRLWSLVEEGISTGLPRETGLSFALQAMLVSPEFLFRLEEDGPVGEVRRLSDHELASRLSYFLWSSLPDEELMKLADEGALQTAGVVEQQVRRMLRDAKVKDGLVENFAGQWLGFRRMASVSPAGDVFPDFDEALRQAMAEETATFMEKLVREDGDVFDLLTADYTFANARLALHYGLPEIEGEAFQRVSLASSPRRGVMTHGSVLTTTSHVNQTSPVRRGKWVMERILGTPTPPPLPEVPDLDEVDLEGPVRVRLEAHRSDRRCAGCHRDMDVLGLALEHFDAVGAWREVENGYPIDASGEWPKGSQFSDAMGLAESLADGSAGLFRRNLARQMFTYGVGRPPGIADRRSLARAVGSLREGGDRFSELVLGIVESEPFRERFNDTPIKLYGLPGEIVAVHESPGRTMTSLRLNQTGKGEGEGGMVSFRLASRRPLMRVVTREHSAVSVEPCSPEEGHLAHWLQVTLPRDEDIALIWEPYAYAPWEYSDEFTIEVPELESSKGGTPVALGDHDKNWWAPIAGPVNPRPGTVAQVTVTALSSSKGALEAYVCPGTSWHDGQFNMGASRPAPLSPGKVTFVGRRTQAIGESWDENYMLMVKASGGAKVTEVSPVHFIRPKLGIEAPEKISLQKDGLPARITLTNTQTATAGSGDLLHATLLYGCGDLEKAAEHPDKVINHQVGAFLIGKDAGKFRLTGEHVSEDGRSVLLLGEDGEPGLMGGANPEREMIDVEFLGAKLGGDFEAAVRIVTQAGNLGKISSGVDGEPHEGLYYVDIPVRGSSGGALNKLKNFLK